MKATVQYNDYCGTTAADRSDVFIELPGQMTQIIVERFKLPHAVQGYKFKGVSVYGTDVKDVSVDFFFENPETLQVVYCKKSSASLQDILSLFKRFEFQVGYHLDNVDECAVAEME